MITDHTLFLITCAVSLSCKVTRQISFYFCLFTNSPNKMLLLLILNLSRLLCFDLPFAGFEDLQLNSIYFINFTSAEVINFKDSNQQNLYNAFSWLKLYSFDIPFLTNVIDLQWNVLMFGLIINVFEIIIKGIDLCFGIFTFSFPLKTWLSILSIIEYFSEMLKHQLPYFRYTSHLKIAFPVGMLVLWQDGDATEVPNGLLRYRIS